MWTEISSAEATSKNEIPLASRHVAVTANIVVAEELTLTNLKYKQTAQVHANCANLYSYNTIRAEILSLAPHRSVIK